MAEGRAGLAPDLIGKDGQLQEWHKDRDPDVRDIHHRHVSHLHAAYPPFQITPDETPELAEAAKGTPDTRGDEATGWGIGRRICLWARLGDGERAWKFPKRQLTPDRTYTNLFDAHPPFQIDGNFGGATGILEMLAFSRPGRVDLLHALPNALSTGSVKGMKLRGDILMDLLWQNGTVTGAAFTAATDTLLTVAHGGEVQTLVLAQGQRVTL